MGWRLGGAHGDAARPGAAGHPLEMSQTETKAPPSGAADKSPSQAATPIETDQAEREASGAHPCGRYLEEFEVVAVYTHWPAMSFNAVDLDLFCILFMNYHPLHINDVYAR